MSIHPATIAAALLCRQCGQYAEVDVTPAEPCWLRRDVQLSKFTFANIVDRYLNRFACGCSQCHHQLVLDDADDVIDIAFCN